MPRYAVITGCSTSSIGFLAAKKLCGPPHNFRVIIGCRNEQKGIQAITEIRQAYDGGTKSASSSSSCCYDVLNNDFSDDDNKNRSTATTIVTDTASTTTLSSVVHVTYLPLDLASFDSIRKFVHLVREIDNGAIQKYGLRLLVNNAGVGWSPRTTNDKSSNNYPFPTTKDGIEEIIGVNHFGHFLLTNLLLTVSRANRRTQCYCGGDFWG